MKTQRLTARYVTRARSRTTKYEITCSTLRGFILRVLPSGKKIYYVRFRTGGKDRRKRIGTTEEVSFAAARQRAVECITSAKDEAAHERSKSIPARVVTNNHTADTGAVTSPRVKDFAQRFVTEHVDIRLKQGSHYKYRQLLRTMILPRFGNRRLHEVTRAEVIQWHGAKSATPSEANNGLVVLKSIYSRAIEWGVLPEGFTSPATRVKRFPEQARERYLTPDERERLEAYFESVSNLKYGRGGGFRWESICALRLLAHTGMRRNEVLNLTWSMVDWHHRVVYLPDSKTGRRAVPLSSAALELLRKARDRKNPSEYVVPSSKGTAILGITLSKTWMTIRARVGLHDVRLHDLRHSAASDAINSGVPLAVVGKILGHRKASTTQRYAHLSDAALAEGVEKMGRAITKHSNRKKAVVAKKRRRKKAG